MLACNGCTAISPEPISLPHNEKDDQPMPADIQETLGLYALGALADDEREQVEQLLEHSPEARAQLADHYAAVEELGTMAFEAAPDHVWHGIRKKIHEGDPAASRTRSQDAPQTAAPSPRAGWVLTVAAAALAVVLGIGAMVQTQRVADLNERIAAQEREADSLATEIATREVQIGALNDTLAVQAQQADQLGGALAERDARIDELQAALAMDPLAVAAQRADAEPDTLRIGLAAPEVGAPQMTVVINHDGRGYVTHSQLDPLDPERTYQLWAVMGDGRVVSAAVLGPEPGAATFAVDLENLEALAVTEEIRGGVVASQNDAVLVGEVDV